jgi:hypothetical protein
MAPGLSMSRGIFSFRRGAVMVILLAAALLWPQRAGGSDWFEGKNYRDRHYENDLYRAGVAVDTGSLIKAVQGDAREEVRRWAAIILGRRHEDTAQETLWSVAHRDGSAEVRKEALLALARLGEASVLPALEQIMREGHSLGGPDFLAAQLAELGDVSGYEYVEREATAASPMRRRQSVYLLREFLPYRHKETLASDPFERLVALTHDPDRSVREDAVMGLELAWWQGVSIEEIRKAMSWMLEQKEDPELGEVAKRHLNTIESYQQNVDAGRIKRP